MCYRHFTSEQNYERYRSSHRRCSIKIDVLQIFTKVTGKHLCQNLFLRKPLPSTVLKRRLWHRCFPVNFVKCSRTPPMATSKSNINKNGSSSKSIMCILDIYLQPCVWYYMIKKARITKWSETIDTLPKGSVSGNLKTGTYLLPSLGTFFLWTSANVAQIFSKL